MIGEHLSALTDAEFQTLYHALYGSGAPDKESAAVSAWYDVLRAIADDENDRRIGATRRVLTDYEPLLSRAARGLTDDELAVLVAATMVIIRGMTAIPADHPFVKHEAQLLGILQGEYTRRQIVGV